jgi:hypothetical protein
VIAKESCVRRIPLPLGVTLALACLAGATMPARAAAQTAATAPAAQPAQSDPDVLIDALQPDFTLAALPTTLRMPRGKWAFRVTHRFTRALGQGDFGDLLRDAFGFDGGAQIGLELRYGLLRGTQVGVHRTSDRTIQLFAQQNLLNQRSDRPVGLDVLVAVEGENNLRDQPKGIVGVLVSRNLGRRLALYAEPVFVGNANGLDLPGSDNSTVMIGLGGRLRVLSSTYLLGEISPRVAGFDPGVNQVSFGVEHRAGGHLFQLNFSNGFGTTLAQIADGGISDENWYIGFNIARKFF